LLFIVLTALIVAGIKAALYFKKRSEQRSRRELRREDFEKIYKSREEWLKLLEGSEEKVSDFFRTLNQIQFKESWTDEDLDRCRESFKSLEGVWND
jgi:predicted nuclease with TOPRIM domain